MNTTHDPAKYRKLTEPMTRDAANDNLEKFFEEIGPIREKYGIADAIIISSVMVDYGEGKIAGAMTFGAYGDSLKQEMMVAWCLGQIQAERRERINELVSRPRS